ncbi:APC family permease [Kineococcus glutinatus]|uniref:APC family permease n=1 Tax=Kineococcus glutinatus TaxID=1070872 RepID=A0ABP9H762_9ACTN
MASAAGTTGETAGALERSKLQRHFGRLDIFFFLVCTLVGIDGLGTLATVGGQGFTWTLICVALFAVPSAMLLAELGAALPDEGGPYVWVRAAFGHLAGAVNNFFYWVTNPVWMGGTLVGTALGGLITFYNGGEEYSRAASYVFAAVFIWAGVLFAVLSFRVGKWIATIGAIARFVLLGLFSVVVVLYGAEHGFHGPSLGEYAPTFSGLVALVPLILFSLVGFELPSAAGEEMEDAERDVPAGIAKSVVATALLYGLPVLGILLVLPTDQATGLTGFPDAVKQALTVFGGTVETSADGTVVATLSGAGLWAGYVMGALVAVVAFTSGLTWIMGSDRTLAVSCYDGAGPRALGTFSARFGTPVRVNVLSGVMSSVVFVAVTEITSGSIAKFFGVALGLAISTTLISYLGIFPAAWKLRRSRPELRRPYRAPALGLLTVVSTGWILFCTVQLLFPGLGDDWFGEDYRPDGWEHAERWTYLLTEFVPLVLFVAIAVAFWAVGRREARAAVAAPRHEEVEPVR